MVAAFRFLKNLSIISCRFLKRNALCSLTTTAINLEAYAITFFLQRFLMMKLKQTL